MERFYDFTLTGDVSLLMHRDDVLLSDLLKETRDAMRREERTKGDDRSPAWTWQTYLYHDGIHVTMPCENVMSSLREGAAKVSTGKGTETFKRLSQSGIRPLTEHLLFYLDSRKTQVAMERIKALADLPFNDQVKAVREMGFNLSVKRAKVGQAKHVRVRPIFNAGWVVQGQVCVSSDAITEDVLTRIFAEAGRCGLGDWRPSSKTPGVYGLFVADINFVEPAGKRPRRSRGDA